MSFSGSERVIQTPSANYLEKLWLFSVSFLAYAVKIHR